MIASTSSYSDRKDIKGWRLFFFA